MDRAVHHALDRLLDTVAREFGARVPPSGPFGEQVWEVPLPPPYGPSRRLALRVHAGSAPPHGSAPAPEGDGARCTVDVSVDGPHGRRGGMEPVTGARAAMPGEVRGPATRSRIERFLARALAPVDDEIAPTRPLDLPLVAVDRDGAPYAALDPRHVHAEHWGPGRLLCADWRLLLWSGDGWRDAGVARDQAETERFYLHDRVLHTLRAFDGLSADGFRFRIWEDGAVPPPAERVDGGAVDRADPTAARLREICRAVILRTPNQEEALVREIGAMGAAGPPAHPPPPPTGFLARAARAVRSLFRRA